jgi:transposase
MKMSGALNTNAIEIDLEVLRGVAERARAVMSAADHEALSKAIEQLVVLNRLVLERGTTIARLRRLFHLSGSEKTEDVFGLREEIDPAAATPAGQDTASSSSSDAGEDGPAALSGKKGKNKGRNPSTAYKNADRISVPHPDLKPGSICPACERAKLHEMKTPARTVRLEGKPPIEATCWECQRLRCSACGELYTAPAPPEAQGDKHTETAAAAIAVLHYGAGMPFHRLARMQSNLQTPLPSSTQWDIMRNRAERLLPAYAEMVRRAADGTLLHTDDTYARILALMGKRRRRLEANDQLPSPERTGIFTSGVLAMTDEKQIALFFTGRKHAGENVARVLKLRAAELAPPVLMSDALARNVPLDHPVIEANCLSHGRRNVVDEIANFPEESRTILEHLRIVFKNDEDARQQRMSDIHRLRHHQKHSGLVLGRLRKWMRKQFRDRRIEENSGLGSAIRYLLKHWRKLTLFLRRPGVPLTNNILERALKMAIRHRNNSYFFRSEEGARVGDLYMSLIHTAELHGANPFDYLSQLLCHAVELAAHPEDWMPWNYRPTIESAATGPPATVAA